MPIAVPTTEDDAQALMSALVSDGGCEVRQQAISRYSRSDDNERDGNAALKRRSVNTAAPIKQQVLSILALMEDGREGRAKILALTEKTSQFDKLDRLARNRALEQMRQELLQIIYEPKERVTARVGAPWLLARVVGAAADHPNWKIEWAQALGPMLKSPDSALRVVGAATAALHRFPEGSDPNKADIVRPLIDGLSHDSVAVRATAYLGLRQLQEPGTRAICFDATDAPDRRVASIRKMEEWLDANRERLKREKVDQWLY
jgi:hypothetical protein